MKSVVDGSSFERHYKKNIRWGLWGSIAFEIIALLHRIMIFATLALPSYGIIVSMLSLIHLGSHIADWGATNSVAPLLSYFTRSKLYFRAMIVRHTLTVHIPLLIATICMMMIFLSTHATVIVMPGKLALFAFLVFVESVRNFMRQFLYTVQQTQWVVITELSLLVGRLAVIWSAYGFFQQSITPFFVLMTHVIEMIVCIVLFVATMHAVYQKLPDDNEPFPSYNRWHFSRIKFFNYILRLSRTLFSAHFLTPFLAVYCGLSTAGIFYFASKLATALLGVIKITIGYTGNGLLAAAKCESEDASQKVFKKLSKKLFFISLVTIVVFSIVGPIISCLWYTEPLSWYFLTLSFLFLLMSVLESWFILYECLYILQHRSSALFAVKVLEVICFYLLCYFCKTRPPFILLAGTVVLRVGVLLLVVLHGPHYWNLVSIGLWRRCRAKKERG